MILHVKVLLQELTANMYLFKVQAFSRSISAVNLVVSTRSLKFDSAVFEHNVIFAHNQFRFLRFCS